MIFRPTAWSRAELVVKRSRFVAEAGPIVSRETAEQHIGDTRKAHPDANHVVYAYAFGPERSVQFAMSDAGEPRNTAGRPTLEVLKGSGLTDCIVVIVRYFGGTKLGTGGLVHAYGEAARQVLAKLPREERVVLVQGQVLTTYELYESVKITVAARRGRIVKETFGVGVEMTVEVPQDELEAFERDLRDATSGKGEFNCFT